MKANVTCVQMQPVLYDKTTNLDKMAGFVETIMEETADTDFILFPELITTGYECEKRFQLLAEIAGEGESFEKVSALARQYKIYIAYGFAERDPHFKDVLYNSVAMVDRNGSLMGVYRKVHLFDTEKGYFRAGCEYPVFDTDFGKLGIMVCWDTAFPEVARIYALQGVSLIAVSTNWEKPYADDWDLITRARAFDNCVHLVAANRIGTDKTLGFFGHSKIMDPNGRPLKQLDEEVEGTISAQLDLTIHLQKRHEYYTFFKDRRPDTYSELIRKY